MRITAILLFGAREASRRAPPGLSGCQNGTMKRVRVVVTGRVQGVGYRYSLWIVADRAGLSGWVRNRYDGSVEAELEGPGQGVADVLTWMLEGPPGAWVQDRRVTPLEPLGEKGFRVRGDA